MAETNSETNETTQRQPVRLRRWLIVGTFVVLVVSAFVFGLPIYRAHLLTSEIEQRGGRTMRSSEFFQAFPDPDSFMNRVGRFFNQLRHVDDTPEFVDLSECDLSEAELNSLLARLHYFDDLILLDLSGTRLTDEGLGHIAGLKEIEHLSVSNTHVGNSGMKYIARLEKVIRLDFSETRVTDDGLRQLQNLINLEQLSLDGTNVSDAGLKSLHNLKKLSSLELSNTSVTEEGVTSLLQKLPGLEISDD